ncbi:acyltransferase [Streptomyces sp. ICBB 8177]|nr:acyltransferase [Streptomyces sp. ICBB 8177]
MARWGGERATRPSLPSLTGMRWVAALAVFGLHVDLVGYFGGIGGKVVDWGFAAGDTGVSFFFVLSGFVLMWSARPRDRAVRFWRRRFARVYPVHLATVGLALLMAYTITPYMKPDHGEVAANLLLVHSWTYAWRDTLNPVSWSLACEAFFYALFPLLARALRRCSVRVTRVVGGVSVLAVVLLPSLTTWFGIGWSVYYSPLARLPEFVLGAVLARLVLLDRWRGPGRHAALAITAVCYFAAPAFGGNEHAAVTILGFTLLIPAAARADLTGEPSSWRHPALVRLGELSFAFYMIHLLVIRAVEAVFHSYSPHLPPLPAFGVTAAVFATSLGFAWLLYEGVECPARRLVLREWRAAFHRPRPNARAGARGGESVA